MLLWLTAWIACALLVWIQFLDWLEGISFMPTPPTPPSAVPSMIPASPAIADAYNATAILHGRMRVAMQAHDEAEAAYNKSLNARFTAIAEMEAQKKRLHDAIDKLFTVGKPK